MLIQSKTYRRRIVMYLAIVQSYFGQAQTLFSNVSQELGVTFKHVVEQGFGHAFDTGAAWFDADGDGDLDLYISQRNGSNKLYRNNIIGLGQSDFTDVADLVLQDSKHLGSGVSIVDYDNDGDLDIYLANANEDVLLRNEGGLVFSNVTESAFPEFPSFLPGRGGTATWGDINNDGWVDLYISNHMINGGSSVDYFFISNGDYPTTFKDKTALFAKDFDNDGYLDNAGFGFVSVMTDYDNDGDLDIYVTNDCPWGPEDNKLWRNDGNLNFIEVSSKVGPFTGGSNSNGSLEKIPDCQNVMGIAVGDPNRDGKFDMYYTNWDNYVESAVFLNNDGQHLLTKTLEVGLQDIVVPETNQVRVTWGTVFIDYNLDMLQDLAVAAGPLHYVNNTSDFQPNILYQNLGIQDNLPQYSRIEDEISGIADPTKGRTLVSGDYDLDGDVDLFLVNFDGDAMLFQNNNSNQNNWLNIVLDGAGAPFSNRNGIGAKIKVTTPDGISQYWEMRSGSSLGGGDDIAAYFGLALNKKVDIEVNWPSGIIQILEDQEVNQRMIIHEPALRVLTPNLNDTVSQFESLTITWDNQLGGKVNVQLLQKNKVVATLLENYVGEQMNWKISSDILPASNYTIQVTCSDDPSKYAKSYGYFNIIKAKVTAVSDQRASEIVLQNFPNPFNDQTTINYYLSTYSPVQIDLYNLSGQKIRNLIKDNKPEGHYQFQLDGNELKNGIYFYVLTTNNNRVVRSFVKNP